MKILLTLAPAPVGGLEEVVLRLAGGLQARGHEVAAAIVREVGVQAHPMEDALAASDVRVFSVPLPGRAYRRERKRIGEILQEWKPEVLHTHGSRSDVLHSGLARKARLPAVTTLHGFTGGDWRNRLYERLQLRSVRTLDGVVVVSRSMVPRLVAAGVAASRIRVIPNAWSARHPVASREEARAILGVAPGRPHIGWVGRLSREKGAELFVQALGHLSDLPFTASVVGDGPLAPELVQGRASLSDPTSLHLHGALQGAGRLFPAFDLFVLSSRTEGTPIVLFEAMAAGVPIVATAVGGVPDVLDDNSALLVPPEQPAALAAAIRDALADPEGSRVRALNARARLHQEYAEAPWLAGYETLYSSVIRNHPIPR